MFLCIHVGFVTLRWCQASSLSTLTLTLTCYRLITIIVCSRLEQQLQSQKFDFLFVTCLRLLLFLASHILQQSDNSKISIESRQLISFTSTTCLLYKCITLSILRLTIYYCAIFFYIYPSIYLSIYHNDRCCRTVQGFSKVILQREVNLDWLAPVGIVVHINIITLPIIIVIVISITVAIRTRNHTLFSTIKWIHMKLFII